MKGGKLNIGIIPTPYVRKWQESVDILSEISSAQLSVLMRVDGDFLEVIAANGAAAVPVNTGYRINKMPRSFFEKIAGSGELVCAVNDSQDVNSKEMSDLNLGFVSCIGIRLVLPDDELFGLLCVLYNDEISFNSSIGKIISGLRRIIEIDLRIYIHDSLINDDLKSREFRFEERFRQIAENITEVFWIVSSDWNEMIYVSPAYEEIWGKSCRSLYEDPRSWLDSVAADDRESVLSAIRDKASGDITDPGFPEYRIIRPDGSIRWIYARAFPVRNAEGETYRMAGIAEDITGRKNIELELKLKENALDSSLSGIGISDMKGKIVYVNPSMVKMWGYDSADEIKGRIAAEFWEKPDMAVQVNRDILKNEIYSGLLSALRKDGSVFMSRFFATMLKGKDGRAMYLMGSFLNVTEELKSEQILMDSEARLKEAQEIANLGYWDYDIKNDRLTWSDEMYRIFNLEPGSVVPTYEAFLDNVHPDEREFVNQIYTGFIYSRIPYDIVHRFDLKDGTVKYVNERCRIECDSKGKAVRSFGTVLDITGRIESENQLKDALKEKEALIHEIYHRTRNNMQIICGLMELKASYLGNSELAEQCMEIENRIMFMALAHEKLSRSGNLSKIDFREYIEELVELLLKRYRVSDERITVSIDVENINLLIDYAVPCGLILGELLSNSFKHAFPGGRRGNVSVKCFRTGEYIEIHSGDDGCGLPVSFDINNADSFGLMIMKNIVISQLRGIVECKNESGVSWRIVFNDNKYYERV